MHHTGLQEEVPVVVPEEQAGADLQEIQTQKVSEAKEPGEELSECVDHQPSSFERGKPWSILILLVYKAINYI
jgi:hypothetical protein